MKSIGKAFSFFVVGTLALVAVLTPTTAVAQEMDTLSVSVYECPGLETAGVIGDATDCTPTSGNFVFYLYGDGSGDSVATLPVSGSDSIVLQVGTYDIYETTTGTMLSEFVVPVGGASLVFGIPGVTAPPPDPEPEYGTVNVNTFACPGVESMVVAGEIADDCIRVASTLTFYLEGDGTDDYWQVVTNTANAAAIEVPVGNHVLVDEPTQSSLSVGVAPGVSTLNIAYPLAVEPELGTLNINTVLCEDIDSIVVVDSIGDDCVRVATNLTFYLIGDGTDDYWSVTTSDANTTVANLPVGDYEIVDEGSQARLFVSVATGTADLNIAYPMAVEPEMGTLNINTVMCDDIDSPIVTDIVGDDCVRVASTLSFYLIGDGTDDYIQVATSATETTVADLPVGDYEIVDEPTQVRLFASVATGTADLNIAYPMVEEPVLGTLHINTVMCEDVDGPVVVDDIDEDCVRVGKHLTFYLIGDGTDDHWSVTTSNAATTVANLPLGDYEIVDEASQARLFATVAPGTAELNIAYQWVDDPDPVEPTPTKPVAPPVSGLPETGTGNSSNNLGALGGLLSGAMLTAGALGVRIRKA